MNKVLNPSKKRGASLMALLGFDACSDNASTPTETDDPLAPYNDPAAPAGFEFGSDLSDSKVVNAQLGLQLRGT